MQIALDTFYKAVNPDGQDVIILLLDRAGWHVSQQLKVPSKMLLTFFPPYTPELSPAEPLIGRVKRPIANRTLKTLDEIEDLICRECRRLINAPQEVRSLTYFTWIRNIRKSV